MRINKGSWAGDNEQRARGAEIDAKSCREGAKHAKSDLVRDSLLQKAAQLEAAAKALRRQAANGQDHVVPERRAAKNVPGNVSHEEFVQNAREIRHSKVQSVRAHCRAEFERTGRFEIPPWASRE